MINQPKQLTNNTTPNYIKAIATIGTTLCITLNSRANPTSTEVKKEIAAIFKKNPDKEIVVKVENNQSEEKTAKFEMTPDTISALDFAIQNVDKYYPDMKQHLDTMINSFRDEEHKEATTKLLNEMTTSITDPKQKTAAIIAALEWKVFVKSTFANAHEDDITDETFDHMIEFWKAYKERANLYFERLSKKLEVLQQKLQENEQKLQDVRQEIETNISMFSIEDVKSNAQIKTLIIQIQQRFNDNNFVPSTHIQALFDATK